MSFRQKIFLILGASQLLLVVILAITFIQMIDRVKNEPQDKRAQDRSSEFRSELKHKEEVIRLLLKEIERNAKTKSILESGIRSRSILEANLDYFKGIMSQYDLSIFEILDTKGKVFYRFHRPKDFGDDKSGQKIVMEALNGRVASTLEIGHSGLGLRVTSPLNNGGLILVGQVVDEKFLHSITGEDVHMAIFEKGKLVSSSDRTISEFLSEINHSKVQDGSRLKFSGKHFYISKIPYESKGLSELRLDFILMIDETELHESTRNLWIYCGLIALIVFSGILIASYLFSRDIIHAVKALNFAMKNPEEDETMIIDLNRSDELGEMGEVFIQMKKDLMEHQSSLESKVIEKTKELQETLGEVQTLKEKQDGDYYLTSLLLKPLASLLYQSQVTKIESVLKQKKNFKFRNRFSEIGGDLVSIQEITLYGKKYLVLMNSDAMGKSIQGAGGALVMGTVFKAIITRTNLSRTNQKKFPEKWLKDCYTELQNVFVTFDGTMLVSAVICLLDEELGALYYVNAEHPSMVLYRDGKASFIDQNMTERKLGFTENSIEPRIGVFKIESRDLIFIGSDGKDDLLIESPESGDTVMNEDEYLFLRFIEISNGNLHDLERLLETSGEISDDLSLMRIGYKENNVPVAPSVPAEYTLLVQEGIREYKNGNLEATKSFFHQALEIENSDPTLLKQLARISLNSREFEQAIEYCNAYLNKFPFDNEYIYYVSYAYRKTKDYNRAIEFSEKLRSREPENIRNLKHLVELYRLTGSRLKFKNTITFLKILVSKTELMEEEKKTPEGALLA
ncbi:stage II sporulation protein E [Leptospira perolatii]|uniref:Stage II sporulation protein E n=1 Tax=Leptospira perolatii TaxID=2023191 RepID=A0A2M9ZPC7_9LEPT|nr:SpoIIE family protein phosphatase [Leptospira perolatii]PJZ70717.1 stage II sporulation protein E [Leptospira perolatii]PJZ73926.1 stage II sporulation protein E [Leptospira perolatii]